MRPVHACKMRGKLRLCLVWCLELLQCMLRTRDGGGGERGASVLSACSVFSAICHYCPRTAPAVFIGVGRACVYSKCIAPFVLNMLKCKVCSGVLVLGPDPMCIEVVAYCPRTLSSVSFSATVDARGQGGLCYPGCIHLLGGMEPIVFWIHPMVCLVGST